MSRGLGDVYKRQGLESSDSTQLPIASLIASGVKFWIDSGSAEAPMKPEVLPGASGDSVAGEVEGTVGAGDGSGLLEHALIRKSELAAITTPAVCADFNSECMPVIVGQLIFGCKFLGSGSDPSGALVGGGVQLAGGSLLGQSRLNQRDEFSTPPQSSSCPHRGRIGCLSLIHI